MTFTEQKIDEEYVYKTEDVFGKVDIRSPFKIQKELLDDIISALLKANAKAATIEGEVKTPKGAVSYTFKRAKQWDNEKEPAEPCKDTPTSTKKQVSVFTAIKSWITRSLRFCGKLKEALREAWKKAK